MPITPQMISLALKMAAPYLSAMGRDIPNTLLGQQQPTRGGFLAEAGKEASGILSASFEKKLEAQRYADTQAHREAQLGFQERGATRADAEAARKAEQDAIWKQALSGGGEQPAAFGPSMPGGDGGGGGGGGAAGSLFTDLNPNQRQAVGLLGSEAGPRALAANAFKTPAKTTTGDLMVPIYQLIIDGKPLSQGQYAALRQQQRSAGGVPEVITDALRKSGNVYNLMDPQGTGRAARLESEAAAQPGATQPAAAPAETEGGGMWNDFTDMAGGQMDAVKGLLDSIFANKAGAGAVGPDQNAGPGVLNQNPATMLPALPDGEQQRENPLWPSQQPGGGVAGPARPAPQSIRPVAPISDLQLEGAISKNTAAETLSFAQAAYDKNPSNWPEIKRRLERANLDPDVIRR